MTTIENTTELLPNVEAAGVGGRIRHTLGTEYVIGQDDSGNWTGTYNGDTYDIDMLVKTGWSVVNSDSLGEFTEDETAAETQSRREFFRSINQGTILRMVGGRTRYVYVGQTRNDEGQRVFRIVSERYVDINDISADDAELPNDWERIETETGWETVEPAHFRTIEMLLNTRRDNRAYSKGLEELSATHEQVLTDFQTVNAKLCYWAVEREYCSEFERVIAGWNEDLVVLEVLGRPRNFDVALRIDGLENNQTFYISQQARSENEARQLVSEMSTRDILQKMIATHSYFDGLAFVVQGMEDQTVDSDDD